MPARVTQHVNVAVGIACRHDGAASDCAMNVRGLARTVVNRLLKVFGAYNLSDALRVFDVLECDAAADCHAARNAVHLFAHRAHEIASAAGSDVHGKIIRLQVADQFDHRFVCEFAIRFFETRVLRAVQERERVGIEFFYRHAFECFRQRGYERKNPGHVALRVLRAELCKPVHIFFVHCFVRLSLAQFGFGCRHFADDAQPVLKLNVQRFLEPERAVIVKRGDAFGGRHIVWIVLRCYLRDKIENCFFRRAVIPQVQWV